MGYYTHHELEIKNGDFSLIEQFRNESDGADYALTNTGECSESCKWYDHEKDLRAFSLKYPDVIFKLIGKGEESGDLWHEYYKNGKMQKCPAKITYDEFDESKLV